MQRYKGSFEEVSKRMLDDALDEVRALHGENMAVCAGLGVMAVLTGAEVKRSGAGDSGMYMLCEWQGQSMTHLCRALNVSPRECKAVADAIISMLVDVSKLKGGDMQSHIAASAANDAAH